MALKDLRTKKKLRVKEASNYLWRDLNGLKLLEDKRSILYNVVEQEKAFEWEQYYKRKAEGDPYFKAHTLALSFMVRPVSLKKTLHTFPYLKRGSKGYLLEDKCLSLFSADMQKKANQRMENKGVKPVYFKEVVILLPPDYFRLLKQRS